MKMDYSELTQPASIEIPACMGAQQPAVKICVAQRLMENKFGF
jgi:hypothetical protein